MPRENFSVRFSNKEPITPYLASAYAEGFCEGEGASLEDQLHAWSYIYGNNLHKTLQGWYGRTLENMLEQGLIDRETAAPCLENIVSEEI